MNKYFVLVVVCLILVCDVNAFKRGEKGKYKDKPQPKKVTAEITVEVLVQMEIKRN